MVDASGHTEKMANLFDKLSDSYDEVGVDFFQPIAAKLLASMPPKDREQWLDIGCGRGAVLLPAAEAIGQHGLAVGIDISSGMIEHARRLALHAGLRNVECEVDDAQSPATVKGPFASDDGVEKLFVDAGFADVRTESANIMARFDNSQHWYDFTWSVGQRMMWLAIRITLGTRPVDSLP